MNSRCGSVRPTGRVLNCQIGTRHSPAMSTDINRSSRMANSISSIVRWRNAAASFREGVSAAAVSHHSMALSSSEPRATEASASASSCSVKAPEDTRKALLGSPEKGRRTGSRLRANAKRPSRRYSVSASRSRSTLATPCSCEIRSEGTSRKPASNPLRTRFELFTPVTRWGSRALVAAEVEQRDAVAVDVQWAQIPSVRPETKPRDPLIHGGSGAFLLSNCPWVAVRGCRLLLEERAVAATSSS